MSLAILHTRALVGIESVEVRVEVHLSNGMPKFFIVGMPETAVKESRERVKSAINNSNFEFPNNKLITVNLSPADIPKEGSRYDLAIAIGILIASGQIRGKEYQNYDFIAELSLNGQLRPVKGVLPSVLGIKRKLLISKDNAEEASLVKNLEIYPAEHIIQVVEHLNFTRSIDKFVSKTASIIQDDKENDLSDIKGQASAKRALEIAASGFHNILFWGPPGSGKSMLARSLPTILPLLSEKQALESAAINSIKNGFDINKWRLRPFRAPHHTASAVALVGGGSNPAPGEISLAHNGVLFLDELPEFERKVLEVMREPLETGHINISRATRQITFPANFLLIAAMNPCPCGHLGDNNKACTCSKTQIQRYLSRLSGPLLDRIDLHIEVPQIPAKQLWDKPQGETSSAEVRKRVVQAQRIQFNRNRNLNSNMNTKQVEAIVYANQKLRDIIQNAMEKLSLSARGAHKVIKIARTIADMQNKPEVEEAHLFEALSYRNKIASFEDN